MKLSLMTFMCEIPLIMEGEWTDEKTARVEEVIRQVSETGFTAIDITDNTVNFIGRERIKDLLAGLGLEVASLICFYRLSDPFISDEEAIEPYLQGIKDAKYLGCKHLMLVPGIAPPEADTESMTKAMIRRNRMIVQEAEKEGIACMVEDDPDITKGMCSLKDLKSMLDAVPGLKVVFDSANMYPAGEQTVPYMRPFRNM